jgi:precorrin isomerase
LRIIASGGLALIIGVPVGFVGAVKAKEELKSGLPYTQRKKGRDTIAVAIVNMAYSGAETGRLTV